MSRGGLAAAVFLLAAIVGFGVGRSTSMRGIAHSRPRQSSAVPVDSPQLTEAKVSELSKLPKTVVDRTIPDPANRESEIFTRFFEILLPLYDDDAYHLKKSLFAVTLRDKEAQAAVFDLIMSLDDPAMLDDSGTFLTYGDPGLVSRMVKALTTDSNPHRRAALAAALGQDLNHPEAQPLIESILTGRDPGLQAAALKWLKVETTSKDPELTGRLTSTLRNLVLAGETIAIRAAAAMALKGDVTEAGTRFLVDRVLNDPNADVQKGAIWSLPIGADQVTVLWRVFRDEARNQDVRREAARTILMAATHRVTALTNEERQLLKSWTESR